MTHRNAWGTDVTLVNLDHCAECEREGGSHYDNCHPYWRAQSESARRREGECERMSDLESAQLPELTGRVSDWLSAYWDGGDPWGSAMSEAFAICDVLYDLGRTDLIPESLGYMPSMFGVDSDDMMFIVVQESLLYGDVTPEHLGAYLGQLDTYLDACKAAGLDY